MIVLYCKFNVNDEFSKEVLFERAFRWIDGMKNVPMRFRNLKWDEESSKEILEGKNSIEIEVDEENDIAAFRLKLEDENEELWTTDYVLSQGSEGKEFELRLSREKKDATAYLDSHFRLPHFLRQLIKDGYGGMDNGLRVSDKPFYITKKNYEMVVNIINGNAHYNMPVIYVTHPFLKEEYLLDVDELARDMAGSAHVLVETDSEITNNVKQETNELNPYNGAIEVYYNNNRMRYLRDEGTTANSFRYRIAHGVYRRHAMLNIPEEHAIYSLRFKNKMRRRNVKDREDIEVLKLEIEDLKEKRKTDKDVIDYIVAEIDIAEKRNQELEAKVMALQESLRGKSSNDNGDVIFFHKEMEFYEDEIKSIILGALQNECKGCGDGESAWRHYHILQDILDNNQPTEYRDNLRAEISAILNKSKLTKTDIKSLEALGFVVDKGSHDKAVFYGDGRYTITIANTPSDHRAGKNMAHDAVNLIFGKYR